MRILAYIAIGVAVSSIFGIGSFAFLRDILTGKAGGPDGKVHIGETRWWGEVEERITGDRCQIIGKGTFEFTSSMFSPVRGKGTGGSVAIGDCPPVCVSSEAPLEVTGYVFSSVINIGSIGVFPAKNYGCHPDVTSNPMLLEEGSVYEFSQPLTDPIGKISGEHYMKMVLHIDPCASGDVELDSYNKGLWNFKFGTLPGEGLVLQDITLSNKFLLDRLSMPHSKVSFADGREYYIRFCPSIDPHTELDVIGDSIRWSFSRVFGESTPTERTDDGILSISYHFIAKSQAVKNCEFKENGCVRLIPAVTYNWNGNPDFLRKFTAYYKLDYGRNAGLTVVSDGNYVPGPNGYLQYLTKETSFNAVDNGKQGRYDNLHSGHLKDDLFVPGCRSSPSLYDCVHIHWRWGDVDPIAVPNVFNIDPLVDPFTGTRFDENERGKPYLVPGQKIDIAILKDHNSERDPDEPLQLANGEIIAENAFSDADGCPHNTQPCLKSSEHPIVWYVSSVDNRVSTTFFKHGLYFLDTTG